MTDATNIQATPVLKAKDFATSDDIKWCPGCGDYSILKQVQTVLAESGKNKEDLAFISGIGCSSRFSYYVDTYGMHSIHGRAPSVATGLKIHNPELSVWVMTGDGDALSIGGNHLIHTLRRNVDLNIVLFNNQIYGLTKGQYSPTSEENKVTKSSPFGSLDYPFNPVELALGARGTFIARTIDIDALHQREMLKRADAHKGTALVEIYQNCNVFNDGAFNIFRDKDQKKENTLMLVHGEPLVFGQDDDKGIFLDGLTPRVVQIGDEYSKDDLWIHDEKDPIKAKILATFFNTPDNDNFLPRPFGVFYAEDRPSYDSLVNSQVEAVTETKGIGQLNDLLAGNVTWEVE